MANIVDKLMKRPEMTSGNTIVRNTTFEKSMVEAVNQCSQEIRQLSSRIYELEKDNLQKENDQFQNIKKQVQPIEEQLKQISEKLKEEKEEPDSLELSDRLKEMEEGLSSHVHKEAVKTYRNVQILLEDYGNNKTAKSLKRYLRVILWFLILITALLISNILGVI